MSVGNAVRNPLAELSCNNRSPCARSIRGAARTAGQAWIVHEVSATATAEHRDDIRRAVADG